MSAYAVLLLLIAQVIVVYGSQSGATHKRRTIVLLMLGLVQAMIGVITLVLQVPLFWGLVHQGGAVVLLGFAVAHWRGTKGAYA